MSFRIQPSIPSTSSQKSLRKKHQRNIPSLSNPPWAPKKKTVRKTYKLENIRKLRLVEESEDECCYPYNMWRRLVDPNEMRHFFLQITPEEIGEMEDTTVIREWEERYFTDSQPQTDDEHLYCDIIRQACRARCYELLLSPPPAQV